MTRTRSRLAWSLCTLLLVAVGSLLPIAASASAAKPKLRLKQVCELFPDGSGTGSVTIFGRGFTPGPVDVTFT
jgi:hypothetical protein